MSEVQADYDRPWKEALSLYFERFLAFFFPGLHATIDWNQPYLSLDNELSELVRDSDIGTQFPDKLFEVQLITGKPVRIMIHVEVQSQYDADFNERIYRYNYRAFDKYEKPVVSVAILGDDRPAWRPCVYEYTLDRYRLKLEFPTAKLLDYESQWQMLEADDNPFALMVMAHLKTQATTSNMETRKQWKWTLVRFLLSRGYTREQVVNLFRFVDRMMTLPQELEQQFKAEVIRDREAKQMRFMSQIEEMAMEEGIEVGITRATQQTAREDALEVLQVRFGDIPPEVVAAINGVNEVATLKQLHRQAIVVGSVAEFQQLLAAVPEN